VSKFFIEVFQRTR